MSTASTAENTSNKLVTNYNSSKLILGNNTFEEGNYTNTGYDVTLAEGTVMGRISATGKVIPLESDASDGSQYPIGVLAQTQEVAEDDDAILSICTSGKIDEGMLVFTKDGDSLSTVVDGRQLRDRLAGDTVGIVLKAATENTNYDNQ